MYYALYDKDFNTIGETYLLESWKQIRRSHDFDDMSIVGEKIPLFAEPFFVVVNDRQGKLQFSGLASTPDTDEKTQKTSIVLKDFKTLWNTDILVDWGYAFIDTYSKLSSVVDKLLSDWVSLVDVGIQNILWDVSEITDIDMDTDFGQPTGKKKVHVYKTLIGLMYEYSVYCTPIIDLYRKSLTFVFNKADVNYLDIDLKDFKIDKIEKSFGEYNRTFIYDHRLNLLQKWGLTQDNSVVKLPSSKSLVYPAKSRVFICEEGETEEETTANVNNTVYEAVMDLSENRYEENIDLDVVFARSIVDLSFVDFSYYISVYMRGKFYKNLPVGEIEKDSKGTHIIRIGYRKLELTQEL